MTVCAMTGYGWSWRLCQRPDCGRLDDLRKAGAMLLRIVPAHAWLGIGPQDTGSGLYPEYSFGKKCRCGLVSGVGFPEPVGVVSWGVGNMLLMAMTTRRVPT